ncbi:hypothetical protein FCO27_18615 [Bacillus pumilus]|uniref:hypothetical protein n=1 Tax=Bacillus pumilus TaxID=1408 RepID=UPI0010BF0725|nr:hypothetical protein [Bacillus pumilus]TKI21741.1 hypothetical protein FCO27_18615 [Bacillus pumilus]
MREVLKKVLLKSISLELIALVDSGVKIDVERVEELSSKNKLFVELKKIVKNDPSYYVLNRIDEEQTSYLEETINIWTTAYSGRAWSKFSVKNNGLNLVLHFLIEELREANDKDEIGK